MNPNNILLKTSAGTDVLESGNRVTIKGLNPIAKNSIVDIKQFKYHAEVVQVAVVNTPTAGAETPLPNHVYTVEFENANTRKGGFTQNIHTYSFTTPATITDLGATAALQMEAINANLITKINADSANNYVTAVTVGGGLGITITDAAGYYPPRIGNVTNGRKGATSIVMKGYSYATSVVTITTAAVYQFGDGTWLANNATVFSPYFQNYVSGSIDTPKAIDGSSAVAGQFYDAFAISSSVMIASSTGMQNQLAITTQTQVVFVDNGTGASTTNLAGFIAFQREMLRLTFSLYKSNKGTVYAMFNNGISYATLTGLSVIPTTALAEYIINLGDGQTISATPSVVATSAGVAAARLDATNGGLNLAIDAANGKGTEISAHLDTHSDKEFTVGKQEFSFYARIYVDDVSGVDPMVMGFRKKAAYQAALASYTDYATIGLIGAAGDIKTGTNLNSGGQTTTDTTLNWADTETHELEVRVSITGAVTFFVDGQQVNKATSFTFDSGDVMIPFVSELQASDLAANVSVIQMAALPTKDWRI